ncbi:hypothetical protein AMTR_s00060p00183840 [Amborella trichopoda]|uniref:C2 domain-containing protein n=1 Tax=Amborella trichopoda TaxID=13333 RepID=W1NJG6_AMBTC|nr:hypothetical protein AMTR_s00060p00183840 [Amborella trichopoda]
MDGIKVRTSTLTCDLNIVKARHVPHQRGTLFVRVFLEKGKARTHLETQVVSAQANPTWDESARLEWNDLAQFSRGTVVFELRHRSVGSVTGSKSVGRVEVEWDRVFKAKGSTLEGWMPLSKGKNSNKSWLSEAKPPALYLSLRLGSKSSKALVRHLGVMGCDSCGCDGSCHGYSDETFALAAAGVW